MLQTQLAAADARLAEIDLKLKETFPQYASLVTSDSLDIAEVQSWLQPSEALVQFLDTPELTPYLDPDLAKPTPEETFIWVVTKTDMRWVRIELGTKALAEHVAALRCGLDHTLWDSKLVSESAKRCKAALGAAPSVEAVKIADKDANFEVLPFDVIRAHDLYKALFGPVEDLIKGKHLLIVPSGPLTSLPFNVLVTEPPTAISKLSEYRTTAWLGTRQPTMVLPSVASLKALRQFAKTSHATKAYLGVGNPLLDGPDARSAARAEMARAKQQCPKSPWQRFPGQVAGGMRPLQKRGGLADVASVRAQEPLPETADELCAVARDLGVPESDIRLGTRATERDIKAMSADGSLSTYRIVHFATHGALASEAREILGAAAEPGLILTPPDEASPEDDGYLSASEIAGLKLDADWVILSACNTAGSNGETAEALSGMARAFFYAGARALLVSHWEVGSDASVKLTTRAFTELKANPKIGRADAFRLSMRELIERGSLTEAHPSQWAPFVVVGEGGGEPPEAAPVVTSSIAAPTAPLPAQPKRPKKAVKAPDWRTEVWR
jgi:CHAT domain-containing protein